MSARAFTQQARSVAGDLLSWGKEELASLGPGESQAGAERLLAGVLGVERFRLYLGQGDEVSEEKAGDFRRLIAERKRRRPLAYLLGKVSFWNEILEVGPGCLIPRPETELLVERFLEESGFGKNDSFTFLDLGSGSGAIGIALLRHFPRARATFSDVSPEALEITQKNLGRYDLSNRAEIVCSDLFESFRISGRGRKLNAVLSNPPYLSRADWETAQPEILFEPRMALDGGEDGLDFYRRIAREAPHHLVRGGWLALEAGIHQAAKVSALLLENNFKNIRIFKDYAGIDRVVLAHTGS